MLTTIERVLFLQRVPLLSTVPTEALAHLASVAAEQELAAGEELWRPGDPADAVYFVLSGELTLRDGVRAPWRASEAADLGMAALVLPDGLRTDTASATQHTKLLRVTRDDFFEVMGEHPELARSLLMSWGNGSGAPRY